jgi:pimeloyl-ACP methyl ester carboxylesterase
MKTCNLSLLISVLLSWFMLAGCASERKHRVLSEDGVAINYSVQGKGKPALVFIHGWCCDKRYWSYQVPYFARRYKVVAVDLAGHGASGLGRKRWTMEAYGADVVAVIEMLGLEDVILVGHSMGGSVIIEAARRMPERVIGLIGIDTFHNFETEYPAEPIVGFISGFEENFRKNTDEFVRDMFTPDSDPNIVERIAEDMSSAPPWIGISSLREYFDYDVKEALKDVRVPIYCINSDLLATDVEVGRRHARSFEVKLMPGMGHFIMIEDPETFNQLLTETVNELSRKEYPEQINQRVRGHAGDIEGRKRQKS